MGAVKELLSPVPGWTVALSGRFTVRTIMPVASLWVS